jgi:hypothetical protein
MVGSLRRKLVDEAIDAYIDWREECAHLWDAYQSWCSAEGSEGTRAFRAYCVALDREEQAASLYAFKIDRLHDYRRIDERSARERPTEAGRW